VVEGTWYINRLFATIETTPRRSSGRQCRRRHLLLRPADRDVSASAIAIGELVAKRSRGVCRSAAGGKYAFTLAARSSHPDRHFDPEMVRGEVGP